MTETSACPFCESEITPTAKKCRHCGEWVSRECRTCGTPIKNQWAARGYCAECEGREGSGYSAQHALVSNQVPVHPALRKSRSISVGLALVLGGLGAHKFYLERPGAGFAYLVFCWTGIPSIIGLFDAVKYIRMEDEEFHQRFYRGNI